MRHNKRRRLNSQLSSQFFVHLNTRMNSNSVKSQPEEAAKAKERVIWSFEDEKALLLFLIKHKAEGGDGMNFTNETWIAAAAEMKNHQTSGAAKTSNSCKSKWARVCNSFNFNTTITDL